MTIAQALVDECRLTLIDAAKVTWSDAELLGYLNSGIAQACGTILDAYVKVTSAFALAAGARQTMPADALVLIDIPRSGTGAMAQQALSELARVHPTWPADTAGDPVYFIYDRRSPLTFLVYPPAASAKTVELVYGAVPATITLPDTIPLSPWYDTPLWQYVLAKAWAKNSKHQDLEKSKAFMAAYTAALEIWAKAKAANVSPPDIEGVH